MTPDLKGSPLTFPVQVAPRTDPMSALERVRELRGVTWEWRAWRMRAARRRRWMGVLAQDVQAVFPEAVVRSRRGFLMVDYNGLVGALIEAVKDLADRVDVLEGRQQHQHATGPVNGSVAGGLDEANA